MKQDAVQPKIIFRKIERSRRQCSKCVLRIVHGAEPWEPRSRNFAFCIGYIPLACDPFEPHGIAFEPKGKAAGVKANQIPRIHGLEVPGLTSELPSVARATTNDPVQHQILGLFQKRLQPLPEFFVRRHAVDDPVPCVPACRIGTYNGVRCMQVIQQPFCRCDALGF